MNECVKFYVDLVSAMLVPVIAVVMAWIAWQQHRLEKNRFKIEIYDKRIIVYKTVMAFLKETISDGSTDIPKLASFYAETREVDFIFSTDEISNLIEEVYSKGIRLGELVEKYDRHKKFGEDMTAEEIHEKGDLVKWFYDDISVVKEAFQKEMKIV